MKQVVGTILKYGHFYRGKKPLDKFDLIAHLPRMELITTFSAINHILKRPLDADFNHGLDNQILMIQTIYQVNLNRGNISLCWILIRNLVSIFKQSDGAVTIASRTSCLYALNEILFSKRITEERRENFKCYPNDYESMFKFLLLCNGEVLEYDQTYETEITSDKLGDNFFEAFMFKEIPNNQYSYVQNPINLLERSMKLIQFISSRYSSELMEFTSAYEVDYPEDYLSIIANNLFFNSGMSYVQAYRVKKTNTLGIKRMDALSVRGKGKPNAGMKKFEFLEIKKSPLFRIEVEDEIIYILMDGVFLLEKCYDLFFWDFFFDTLKDKGVNIKEWGGIVGHFFEDYADGIFEYMFEGKSNIVYKSTNDLIIDGSEYADYYVRRDNNIVLIQAKRSFLPQDKYKEVYSLEDYERLEKSEFYDRFGLGQMVDMTMANMESMLVKIDPEIPKERLSIFPVLLINEPIISLAITSFVFHQKFVELMKAKGIPLATDNYQIHRLIVIHIAELERIQQHIRDGSMAFDELLKKYVEITDMEQSKNPYTQFQTFDNLIKMNFSDKAIPDYLLKEKKGVIASIMNFGIRETPKLNKE